MKWRVLAMMLALLSSANAFAACDVSAWKFGMSPEEVASVKECGPYKPFRNGDLETYKGIFAGKEENFQFFFRDQKLWRIGVYLYEGQDSASGAEEWLSLFVTLSGMLGVIETPGNIAPVTEAQRAAFKATAIESVAGPGKIQMAPFKQATDVFSYASYRRADVEGQRFFYVTLYFDGR